MNFLTFSFPISELRSALLRRWFRPAAMAGMAQKANLEIFIFSSFVYENEWSSLLYVRLATNDNI